MGQNRKNMSGHFLVHGRWWTLWTLLGPPWTLFSKVTIISQIVQELTQTMSSMFFCQKLTLVVAQNMSGHFLVHGRWWTLVDAVDAVGGHRGHFF